MKEIWRDIVGYEGLYQVSNLGRVRSLGKWIDRKCKGKRWQEEIILKQPLYSGYLYVGLWKNRKLKYYRVHRLVAEAFLDNPHNLPEVNHKDENKQNNFVYINEDGSVNLEKSNLEWCDRKYNVNYGTATERRRKTNTNHPSYSKVVLQYDLNGNFIKEWPSTMEIERQLGFANTHISDCCKGGYFYKERNKWVNVSQAYGYKWKYKNG